MRVLTLVATALGALMVVIFWAIFGYWWWKMSKEYLS